MNNYITLNKLLTYFMSQFIINTSVYLFVFSKYDLHLFNAYYVPGTL